MDALSSIIRKFLIILPQENIWNVNVTFPHRINSVLARFVVKVTLTNHSVYSKLYNFYLLHTPTSYPSVSLDRRHTVCH
jgi:hypothetical protein